MSADPLRTDDREIGDDPITIDEVEAAYTLLSKTESTVPTISDLETDVI
jgi:hypothetical protein